MTVAEVHSRPHMGQGDSDNERSGRRGKDAGDGSSLGSVTQDSDDKNEVSENSFFLPDEGFLVSHSTDL